MGIDEFCDLLQQRARTWVRECDSLGDSALWWGTQRIDRFCGSGRAAVNAGRLQYHPKQAAECAALSVGDCDDIEAFAFSINPFPQDSLRKTDACVGVVTAAVELGGACHADSTDYSPECLDGYCSGGCPGQCSAFLADGDPCDTSRNGCNPATSFCNIDRVCQALVPLGGECRNGETCRRGTICRYDDPTDNSTCVREVPLGADCTSSVACEFGSVCYEGNCADQVPVGAPCITTQQCPEGSYCYADECRDYAAPGADCNGGAAQCGPGYICDGSSCEPLGQEDESCPCATGLNCADGVCSLPGALGEVCGGPDGPSNGCEAGLWCVPTAVVAGEPEGFHCQPVDGLGDACAPQDPTSCPWPLFCHPQTFTCTERALEGESCNRALLRDSCENGLFCKCTANCGGTEAFESVGQCAPVLTTGEACEQSLECESLACAVTCSSGTSCR